MGTFAVERARARASAFHTRPMPDPAVPAVWVCDLDTPAMVLGSTQDVAVADRAALDAAGADLVRRRSGGGAVWLAPGEVLWVDVIVPAGHERWDPDVGRSTHWIGEVWRRALLAQAPDLAGRLHVHTGGLVTTTWSRLVCFAGTGPGEVVIDASSKVVGISQRRTRDAARFQCAALLRWDPEPYERFLVDRPPAATLASVGAGVAAISAEALLAAFVAEISG
jgi:lipoate-protein ligase A